MTLVGPCYSYETDDGISADMSGQNKLIGEKEGIEMSGTYTYTSPEGKKITVRYTGDGSNWDIKGTSGSLFFGNEKEAFVSFT